MHRVNQETKQCACGSEEVKFDKWQKRWICLVGRREQQRRYYESTFERRPVKSPVERGIHALSGPKCALCGATAVVIAGLVQCPNKGKIMKSQELG